jgi:phenylacetate-CoA ligase
MEIWNRHIECMERDELKKVQSERLKETVERVYFNVPYYRNKMQEAGLGPESIQSTDDLHKLPFTTKQDLRDNYPFSLFAVPMSEIVRVHASSGTTGKPTVVGYTRRDIATWSEVMARTLTSAGANRNDFIHIAYGYGLFTGGLGLHYGGEKIGASVIPVSGGNTIRQLQLLVDFGSTVLACTPSYALFLAEAIEEAGIKRNDLKLRVGVLAPSPGRRICAGR